MKESLNHSPGAKPLYAQLYEILLNKLHSGEYKKNTVLPTETEFQELFGVSRITARRALAELVNKGYLKRERGIGTLVIRNSEKQSFNVKMVLMDGQGERMERKNLSLEYVMPSEKITASLSMDTQTEILCLSRIIFRKGTQPAQVNYTYLSPKVNHLVLDNFSDGLYAALENTGQNISSYKDLITAEIPTEEDCRILNIEESVPLLVRTRIGYNSKNEAIECSIAKYISTHYQYIVENM